MTKAGDPSRSRKIIRVIAAERFLRGVLLIGAGAYLLTHVGSDFSRLADHVMRKLELDPHRPFLRHILEKLRRLRAGTVVITGIAALGYGVLELVEGAGLWLDQLWAEYLTVIATSLLIPFEVYELLRKPSLVKAAGIAVNLAIVAYLAHALRRRLRSMPSAASGACRDGRKVRRSPSCDCCNLGSASKPEEVGSGNTWCGKTRQGDPGTARRRHDRSS